MILTSRKIVEVHVRSVERKTVALVVLAHDICDNVRQSSLLPLDRSLNVLDWVSVMIKVSRSGRGVYQLEVVMRWLIGNDFLDFRGVWVGTHDCVFCIT